MEATDDAICCCFICMPVDVMTAPLITAVGQYAQGFMIREGAVGRFVGRELLQIAGVH